MNTHKIELTLDERLTLRRLGITAPATVDPEVWRATRLLQEFKRKQTRPCGHRKPATDISSRPDIL